jgi:hypothetical protein
MAKLTNLEVSFISLVKNPANKKDIVAKASNTFNMSKPITIKKSSPQGLIYGCVYEADKLDAQGDWADMDTIRKAAHDFVEKGLSANIDIDHNENKSGAILVESYTTDKEWNVVIKCNPQSEIFSKLQKGEYQGLSMMGTAIKKDETLQTQNNNQSDNADLQKQVEILTKSLKELTDIVKEIPRSRQIEFDKDGNIITKGSSSDGEVFSEFQMLEV